MGALRNILAFVTNGQASARVRRIQAAAHARHRAHQAWREACRRGDFAEARAKHKAFREATQACLRVEVGR